MKKLFVIPLVLVVISALIFGGCAKPEPGPGPSTEPLRIGSIESRTGWGGVYLTDGADLKFAYADYVNARGGIDGRPIEIVEYDDESEAELGYLYASKLIEQDKVLAITGPVWTDICLATIEATRYSGCPHIYEGPNTPPPEVYEPGSNIYATDLPSGRYFMATVKYLKEKLGAKTLAVLATTGETGEEDLGWIKDAVAELGGIEIVIEERIDPAAIDATPQLTRIKATNPDALHLGGAGNIIGPMMKGYQMLGMDMPVAGGTGFITREASVLIAGFEPEILILPALRPHVAGFDVLPAGHPLIELSDTMWDVWSEKYGESRGTKGDILLSWIAWEMDTMDLVCEAIRQASPLPEDIQAAREAIDYALENKIIGFEQRLGRRTITPTDHIGLGVTEDVIFLTIKDGQIRALED